MSVMDSPVQKAIRKKVYGSSYSSNTSKVSKTGGGSASLPPPPEKGLVKQYTADKTKVRYYNPDSKAATAWYSTATGQQTSRPSSNTTLVTESYIKGKEGAVGKESSGIKKETFQALAAQQTYPKTIVTKEPREEVQYIVGRDKEGRPLTLSKGVSQKYKYEVLPAYRKELYEYLQRVSQVPPEGETLQQSIEKGRVYGVYPVDESGFPITTRIKRKIKRVGSEQRTQLRENPFETLSQSFNAIGTGILKVGTFGAEKVANVRTKSGVYTERGEELTASEYLESKTKDYTLIPKLVEFVSELGTFGLATKPFSSFKPQVSTKTREAVIKQKRVTAEATYKDIRPSWIKRKLGYGQAVGKIEKGGKVKGIIQTVYPAKKPKVSYFYKFFTKGKPTSIGKTATGFKRITLAGKGRLEKAIKWTSKSIKKIKPKLITKKYTPEAYAKLLAKQGKIKYYPDSYIMFKKGATGGKILGKTTPAAKPTTKFTFTGTEAYLKPDLSLLGGTSESAKVSGSFLGIRKYIDKIPQIIKIDKVDTFVSSGKGTGLLTSTKAVTTQISKSGVSAALKQASKDILPKIVKSSTRQDILETVAVGAIGATATELSLRSGVKTGISQRSLQLQQIKPLEVLKEKDLEKVETDVIETPKTTQKLRSASLTGGAISVTPITAPKQKQTPKQKEIPKVVPKPKTKTKTPTIPSFPPTYFPSFKLPPALVLPLKGGRSREEEEEYELLRGYKKFNIPSILLGTEKKSKKFDTKFSFPKITLPEVKL